MTTTPQPRSSKTRLLFVNRSYWPDAEATGQLLTDLCESLADRFDVSVLCGQPNSNPTGCDYVAQGIQVRNRVRIIRLQHTQFAKRKSWGRMANLLSFTHATKRWLRRSTKDRNESFDLLIAETDPFLLPLVVGPHCQATGIKYVAYLQDIYPDIAIRLGKAKDGWFTRHLRRRLRSAYEFAAKVVVLSDAMKQELIDWGIRPDALAIVPNWVDCQSVRPIKTDNAFRIARRWTGGCFVVMHSGNMGLSQKLCALIRAVDEPAFPAHAKLVLIGGGADEPRLRALASSAKRSRDIEFLPYQPRESLAESLSAADLQVVSIDPRIGGTLMPSKLYGILASGTPVLVIAEPASDTAKIVEENELGIVAGHHEPKLIAEAIAEFAGRDTSALQRMQQNARQLAETRYDRSICIKQFADLLQALHAS